MNWRKFERNSCAFIQFITRIIVTSKKKFEPIRLFVSNIHRIKKEQKKLILPFFNVHFVLDRLGLQT